MDIPGDHGQTPGNVAENDWARRLGRVRLGAEPLETQLDRIRRATWALTIVTTFLALFFVALFSAFHAPLVGFIVAGMLFAPVVSLAWIDFQRSTRAVRLYEQEQADSRG